MNRSICFIILLLTGFLFVSPTFAFAQQEDYDRIYEAEENKEEVEELFKLLFGDTFKEEANLVPEGTEIIDFQFKDGAFILNLSKEIKNYGGTLTEWWIVDRILFVGFSIPNVESITLLIEGQRDYLPEGTMIDSYEKEVWLEERMKEEWRELTKENIQKYEPLELLETI